MLCSVPGRRIVVGRLSQQISEDRSLVVSYGFPVGGYRVGNLVRFLLRQTADLLQRFSGRLIRKSGQYYA